ncbi:Tm-1-like ATP-binding domain-containing protein [Kribbella sp. NPDC050241]|uniref:Tm-1-like ATP-binding domain-containing protein n=1 Tax=Kribbella sp. NPDC050241 TaxID=3364115 RepID=UPI0037A816DF
MSLPTVLLAGALDTKSEEYRLACDLAAARGLRPLLVDVSVLGQSPVAADITPQAVCEAAGVTLRAVREAADRSASLELMSRGLARIVADLHTRGAIQGVFAMGGSGALTVAAPAFRALPLGVPKVILTTMAASDLSSVIGPSDLLVMPAVVDLAGVNRVNRFQIDRAVATVAAMIGVPAELDGATPAVGLTMLGVTTIGVTGAARRLTDAGCEALTFHANGAGGRVLEALAGSGWLRGVLDLTTGEIASGLLGGTNAAGPERLTVAGAQAIPQVISVGGCDLVIFGGPDAVPGQYRQRTLYQHGATATLMRTSVEECALIGAEIARRLAAARGSVTVLLPTDGVSALSERGGPFEDAAADEALVASLRSGLAARATSEVVSGALNTHAFGERAADLLIAAL